MPKAKERLFSSTPTNEGLVTELKLQALGAATYFDGAGSALHARFARVERRRWSWAWLWPFPPPESVTITISDD